jgi:hypothetical protein
VAKSVGNPGLTPEMPVYRAYIVGRHSQFIRAIEMACVDDDAAIESAKHLVDSHDVELWQMDRPIARFEIASNRIIRR